MPHLGQLTSANIVGGTSTAYTYDSGWNMTQRAGQAYSVNDRNQITGGEGYTYVHDSAGNRTVRSVSGAGNVTYTYDDENQLIRMETDTSVTPAASRWRTEFVYDGLRRLRSRAEFVWIGSAWYPNTTTLYVYDGRRVAQERNSANVPTVSYVRGLDLSGTSEGAGGIGGLLARSSGYQSGTGAWTSHAFYHADGGGNVTFLSPSTYSGTMTRYSYDAYGRTISLNGPLATANVYRFSSKELHAASGHYYYGYRFYDPQAQRWSNRDPIGEAGGVNLYGFVRNGPVGAVDSFGLHGNVISSTLPGMAGTWTSNPHGAGSPGTLPGDFFAPMPPAWTTPSELADVDGGQWGQICPFDKSSSSQKALRIDRSGPWHRVVSLTPLPLFGSSGA